MSLRKKGKYWYGDTTEDLHAEMLRFSRPEEPIDRFAEPKCVCGGQLFRLMIDESAGAAVRHCITCEHEHPIGDSGEYLDDAELEMSQCNCGGIGFELSIGVSLYDDSEDIRSVYIGARCPACSLLGVYGTWENEFNGYEEYLKQV